MIGNIFSPGTRRTVKAYGNTADAQGRYKSAQAALDAQIAQLMQQMTAPMPAAPQRPVAMDHHQALGTLGAGILASLLGARPQFVMGAANAYQGGLEKKASDQFDINQMMYQQSMQQRQQALQAGQFQLGSLQDKVNLARGDMQDAQNMTRQDFANQTNLSRDQVRYDQQRRDNALRMWAEDTKRVDSAITAIRDYGGFSTLPPEMQQQFKTWLESETARINDTYKEFGFAAYNPSLINAETETHRRNAGMMDNADASARERARMNDARINDMGYDNRRADASNAERARLNDARISGSIGGTRGSGTGTGTGTLRPMGVPRDALVSQLREVEAQIRSIRAIPNPTTSIKTQLQKLIIQQRELYRQLGVNPSGGSGGSKPTTGSKPIPKPPAPGSINDSFNKFFGGK